MRFRSGALAGWLIGAFAVLALFALAGMASAEASAGGRLIALAVAVVSLLGVWRATVGGLEVRPDGVVVRSFFWSRRLSTTDVAGIAIEPVLRRRFARLDVVTAAGEAIPVVLAAWRMGTQALQANAMRSAAAVGVSAADRPAPDAVLQRIEHPPPV